jgi:hypothetical protein
MIGLQIVDCGMRIEKQVFLNPQSEISNPQSKGK